MSEPKRQNPPAELFGEFSERLRGDRWQPGIDIFETEKAVVVRAEIAGVRREDVRVTVDDDLLRISGSRRAPSRTDVRRLHQMEIACGPFERAIRISRRFVSNVGKRLCQKHGAKYPEALERFVLG